MATLFIADLHLCVEEPAITAGFLRFLAGEARKADALYILGDLFEAWIGDDDPNPLHRKMAAAWLIWRMSADSWRGWSWRWCLAGDPG